MNYGAAGAVSIPIVQDRIGIRVSGGFSRDAGYADAYFGPFDGKLIPLVGFRTYHDDRSFRDGTGSVPTKANVQTYRANLTFIPSDSLTMFVTVATGFRPGIVQSCVQVESLELAGVPASVALDP